MDRSRCRCTSKGTTSPAKARFFTSSCSPWTAPPSHRPRNQRNRLPNKVESATAMAVIKTVNLTKRYGTLVALSNLNLEIHEGDCFGFIGPNGAGKSTTIKILATLLQPTWGEARVCDLVVGYQSRQIRPLIGYVPDYFGAYEDMVVQEYLDFFAAAYNIHGTARTKIVNDVLELTDLAYKRDAPVDGLSRGMKQRLSIARVLVHDPKGRLVDRPGGEHGPRPPTTRRATPTPAPASRCASSSRSWCGWARPSSSPATSCPSWRTCVTRSASSSRANCSTAAPSPTSSAGPRWARCCTCRWRRTRKAQPPCSAR